MIRSRLAVFTALSGWTLFITYIIYDLAEHGGSARHFLAPQDALDLFYLIMLSVPIGSTITAYLINERKKLLDKTLQSTNQIKIALNEWKATFDSMPYGVMLMDDKFNIIRANNYIAELSGLSVEDMVFNKKCYRTIHKISEPVQNCPLVTSLKTGRKETAEIYEPLVNKYFMADITPMHNETGAVIAYVHTFIDITSITEHEKKLTKSKNAFFNMLKDLDTAYKEMRDVYNSLVITLSNIIDAKSPWTRGHSIRVADHAVSIAKEMDFGERDIEILKTAALLHDIGKIGACYDVILEKPGALTEKEFDLVRLHPVKGEDLLKPIKGLEKVITVIRSHHEKIDGSGYPDGLRGDEIPILARILCVADSFDAMVSDRPYRPLRSREYAITELKRCSSKQFDPYVIEAFMNTMERRDPHIL